MELAQMTIQDVKEMSLADLEEALPGSKKRLSWPKRY